jgi:purine catabolism regulator
VHKQTVLYRMRRVEQLTGRVLAETADLAELWVALQARSLLTGRPDR